MKMIVAVALALLAISAALPVENQYPEILRSAFESKPEGGYLYSYETADGISRQEQGELKETVDEENKPHSVVVVRGTYTYTDPEGHSETINYYADETGFHPEGESIPKVATR